MPVTESTEHDLPNTEPTRPIRWLLSAVAVICFIIGWVGMFVPGLPTTVFWIVAAICAGKACPVIRRWVYERGRTGAVIRTIVEERSLPAAAKVHATIGLWISLSISAFLLILVGMSPVVVCITMTTVGVGVSLLICVGLRTIPKAQLSYSNSQA